jgi:hypothetical protein
MTVINGQIYVVFDTPGFMDAGEPNIDQFYKVMDCVDVLRSKISFAGILYVEEPSTRDTVANTLILDWLDAFCGPSFYKNITFVSTHWDGLQGSRLEQQLKKLEGWKNGRWSKFLDGGAKLYQHGKVPYDASGEGYPEARGDGDSEGVIQNGRVNAKGKGTQPTWYPDYKYNKNAIASEAKWMIRSNYGGRTENVSLQVLHELDAGKSLNETTAARVLQAAAPASSSVPNAIVGGEESQDEWGVGKPWWEMLFDSTVGFLHRLLGSFWKGQPR